MFTMGESKTARGKGGPSGGQGGVMPATKKPIHTNRTFAYALTTIQTQLGHEHGGCGLHGSTLRPICVLKRAGQDCDCSSPSSPCSL